MGSPAFDRAAGLTVDAVQALKGTGAPPEPVPRTPAGSARRSRSRPREGPRAAYDADLKRLDLLERLGLVLPKVDAMEAFTESGATMARALDRLPARADDLLAAVQGYPAGARNFLRDLGTERRTTIAKAHKASAAVCEERVVETNLPTFKRQIMPRLQCN